MLSIWNLTDLNYFRKTFAEMKPVCLTMILGAWDIWKTMDNLILKEIEIVRNRNRIRKYFRLFIRVPDGFESWKKWRSKISWHTPFNNYFLVSKLLNNLSKFCKVLRLVNLCKCFRFVCLLLLFVQYRTHVRIWGAGSSSSIYGRGLWL